MNNRKSNVETLQNRLRKEISNLDRSKKLLLIAPDTYLDWIVKSTNKSSHVDLLDFFSNLIEGIVRRGSVITYSPEESPYIHDVVRTLELEEYLKITNEKDYPLENTFPLNPIGIRNENNSSISIEYEEFERKQDIAYNSNYLFFIHEVGYDKNVTVDYEAIAIPIVETKAFCLYQDGRWTIKLDEGEELIHKLSTDPKKNNPYKLLRYLLNMKSNVEDVEEFSINNIKQTLKLTDNNIEDVLANLNRYIKESKLKDKIRIGKKNQNIRFVNFIQNKTAFHKDF